MNTIDIIYSIIILVFSVVIHEVSHGYMALLLGDPTAKYEKRLTLNPIRHIDIFGSIIVPIATSFTGVTFGWAKPVPYNPYNLRNPKWGELLIAIAGPISNFVIALICVFVLDYLAALLHFNDAILKLLVMIIVVNIGLMIFNLMPLYPLDGSKILFAFIPAQYEYVKTQLIRYSLPLFLLFLILFGNYWNIIVTGVIQLLLRGA